MKLIDLKVAILSIILLGSISAFAVGPQWMENFGDAKNAAKKGQKYIFANFTGSDWCPWCLKLDQEVLSAELFKEYAEKHLILFKADFPQTKGQSDEIKQQNKKLAKEYRVEGYPTILLLDWDGKAVFRTGYKQGGADPYVESLKKAINKRKSKF